MKVILTKDVEKLGKTGDVIDVKPGFARNYLFTNKLALESSAGNVRMLEIEKKKQAQKEKGELKGAQEVAAKLSHVSLTIPVKVGEEGKIFGSVTAHDVSSALEKEGLEIDKKKIHIEDPISATGVYHVTIKLHPEVSAKVKIWVVKE